MTTLFGYNMTKYIIFNNKIAIIVVRKRKSYEKCCG